MTQSRVLDRILREAKQLRPVDRRRLVRALEQGPKPRRRKTRASEPVALERFIARAGLGHSSSTDVSTDKYKHVADAYADQDA
jgi:hypothetical protein